MAEFKDLICAHMEFPDAVRPKITFEFYDSTTFGLTKRYVKVKTEEQWQQHLCAEHARIAEPPPCETSWAFCFKIVRIIVHAPASALVSGVVEQAVGEAVGDRKRQLRKPAAKRRRRT
eukprot:TRINITY_DN1228_c0_g1_i1.p2 TRINITY_DN1228_c0_g1~~TRINITY_DN1228_c0_g1_i1.p2  ORF type:complete len:118 (+),score=20.76 TRINITY_DN1228_c0_g1_i1:547-900(+)